MDQNEVNRMLFDTLCTSEALGPFFKDETSTQSEKEFLLREALDWCICHDICLGSTSSYVCIDQAKVIKALSKRGYEVVYPQFFETLDTDDFLDISIDEIAQLYNSWLGSRNEGV